MWPLQKQKKKALISREENKIIQKVPRGVIVVDVIIIWLPRSDAHNTDIFTVLAVTPADSQSHDNVYLYSLR